MLDRVAESVRNRRTKTLRLTDELIEDLPSRAPGELVRVRPPRESKGFERDRSFVDDFFTDPDFRSTPPTYSFAPVFENGHVSYLMSAPEGRREDLADAISSKYSGAKVGNVSDPLPISDREGDFVAGARVGLFRSPVFSLRTQYTHDPLDDNPGASYLKRMTGETDETATFLITFHSVGDRWLNDGAVGSRGTEIAETLRDGEITSGLNADIIKPDQRENAARDIQQQEGRDAFAVSIRVLTSSPDRDRASKRLNSILDSLSAVRNAATGQKLSPTRLGPEYLGNHIRAMAAREGPMWNPFRLLFGRRMVLTDEELGTLVHLPNDEEVDVPMDWSEERERERIPSEAY